MSKLPDVVWIAFSTNGAIYPQSIPSADIVENNTNMSLAIPLEALERYVNKIPQSNGGSSDSYIKGWDRALQVMLDHFKQEAEK